MNICFYHSADHDGHTSAAIIKKMIPDVKLYGINYDERFPWKDISKEDTVYMVDFSLEPIDRMIHLQSICKELIWIDHHISQIEEAEKNNFNPNGLRVVGKSGCVLTWEYCFKDKSIPIGVHLLGRFDVWDHSDARTLPFEYGMLLEDTDPTNDLLWNKLFADDEEFIKRILIRGQVIYDYQMMIDSRLAGSNTYEIVFKDLRCLMINSPRCSSLLFQSKYNPKKHDIMMAYSIKPDGVSISFYSDKPEIDVSKLAKSFGGGGHAGAAGCFIKPITKFFNLIGYKL